MRLYTVFAMLAASACAVDVELNAHRATVEDGEIAASNEAARLEAPLVVTGGILFMPTMPMGTNGWAIAVSSSGDLMATHWYGSPTSTVAEIRASLGTNAISFDALRGELKTNRLDIAGIIDLQNTNINDTLTMTITAANATQTSNSIRKVVNELTDTNRRVKDVAQELQDLRAVVLKMLKGLDQ